MSAKNPHYKTKNYVNIPLEDKQQLDTILHYTATIWQVTERLIHSHSRAKPQIYARHAFVFACMQAKQSWAHGKKVTIATYLHRNHSTIINSELKAVRLLEQDEEFRTKYQELIKAIERKGYTVTDKGKIIELENTIKAKDREIAQLQSNISDLLRSVRKWKMKAENKGMPLFGDAFAR